MFNNLPDELIFKIVNYLPSQNIYYLTQTSSKLNAMNFKAILTGLLFKSYFEISRDEISEWKQRGYTLRDYLDDLICTNECNMYNYETSKSKYHIKKTYRFDHNQTNLFEKKKIRETKLHPVYRISQLSYKILKHRNSLQLFALIY